MQRALALPLYRIAHLPLAPHSNAPYPNTPPSPGSRFRVQNGATTTADVDTCTGLPAPGRTTLVRGVLFLTTQIDGQSNNSAHSPAATVPQQRRCLGPLLR